MPTWLQLQFSGFTDYSMCSSPAPPRPHRVSVVVHKGDKKQVWRLPLNHDGLQRIHWMKDTLCRWLDVSRDEITLTSDGVVLQDTRTISYYGDLGLLLGKAVHAWIRFCPTINCHVHCDCVCRPIYQDRGCHPQMNIYKKMKSINKMA